LNHKNYATKLLKPQLSTRARGARVRDSVTFTFRGVAAASGTAATDLASDAGASPRNFRLAGSTV